MEETSNITHSPSLGKIAEALSKAQASMKPAVFNRTNPHYKSKYADLTSVFDACRKPLGDNSIAVVQTTVPSSDGVTLKTMLIHSSGEWVSSELYLKPKDMSPQSVGSALTYARRYGISSLVGISSDEDDDSNAAQPEKPTSQPRTPSEAYLPKVKSLSEAQLKRLFAIASSAGWNTDSVKAYLKITYGKETTKDLSQRQYEEMCAYIEANPALEAP